MADTTTPAAEPDKTTTDAPAADAPVVDTGAAAPAAGEDKQTPEQKAVEAFTKGVEAAKKEETHDAGAPVVEAKDEKVVDGKPVDGKTPPKEAEDDPAKKAAAEVEAEVKTLNLKDKAAERFRELSKRPTEEQVAPLRHAAQKLEEWQGIIEASTAKPPQLSAALGYIQAINSRDHGAMKKAYDEMSKEQAWLAKQLGIEQPGVYDPLTDHPDLKKLVDDGDLPRANALETARHRAESARTQETARQREQREREENEHKAAVGAAMNDIGALNARLKGADPAFLQKLEVLKPTIEVIRDSLPPSRWAAAIEKAYLQIKVAPAAATPPVTPAPIRPAGSATGQVRKFDKAAVERGDPFVFGVANAR